MSNAAFVSFMLLFFIVHAVFYYAFVSLDYSVATVFFQLSFLAVMDVIVFFINYALFKKLFNYDCLFSKLCD